MTVFGESELIKLRNIFEHINGLARLEHATGVIGFMGIKNIITSLCGIKYVLPLKYNVDTIPNFPHVYKVQLSLVDFDIFQQKRESLSNDQQEKFIKEFGSKKNPFLRIKQLWGSFNSYPDMPLELRNKEGEVVGCLDPDYYFRSFEMFDRDVIVNQSIQESTNININENTEQNITEQIDTAAEEAILETVAGFLKNGDFAGLNEWSKANALRPTQVYKYVSKVTEKYSNFKTTLTLDYVDSLELDEKLYLFSDTKFSVPMGEYKVGDLSSGTKQKLDDTMSKIFNQGEENEEYVSVDPDNLMADIDDQTVDSENLMGYVHGMVYAIPAMQEEELRQGGQRVPAMIQTAQGYNFGYLDRVNGRFYLQNNKFNIKKAADSYKESRTSNIQEEMQELTKIINESKNKDQVNAAKSKRQALNKELTSLKDISDSVSKSNAYSKALNMIKVADTQTPDTNLKTAHLSEIGTKALSEYQYAYASTNVKAESTSPGTGDQFSVTKHWEKMLIDTSYRDISGRMIRAYPTYMLWLIDEGGYYYGTKLFDNFYGLQSIIDFSIVQSEDILGDTLVFRVSNMYGKLTTKSADDLFRDPSNENTVVSNNLEGIVDTLLKRQRNIRAHMENKYVVDIDNIRLKPGVRVHLRAGYGSNPNSLQTLFNGVITNVETGEIMTITAQSDAIELSPIINSTNKKGDSGKIDGGLNTGMYLSEPRDLMVKLLSMGTSRFRESIAHATRGTVFSENKFGIRHFGSILYEPLNPIEAQKHNALKASYKNALDMVSQTSFNAGDLRKAAWNATAGSYDGVDLAITGTAAAVGGLLGGPIGAVAAGAAGGLLRSPIVPHMRTLMANLGTQRDYEIFKRNIYAGNGLGVSQFMGGDIDTGWSTAATLDEKLIENAMAQKERRAYLARLGDSQWSRLMTKNSELAASVQSKQGGGLVDNSNSIGASQFLSGIAGAAGIGLAVAGMPVVGGAVAGMGLLGVLNGRASTAVFNAMGLISTLDDDMPGFDEVSFRAQTYMRSVWDMFQTCARLLPNYIVAVRPFEDRSTIFYGKPHWLYTSGVVPISTGFMHPDSALKAGIKVTGPKQQSPDQDLIDLIDEVNKASSPLADIKAYADGFTPLAGIEATVDKMRSAQDEYAPIKYIEEKYTKKLINFYDPRRALFTKDGEVIARLPVIKGNVNVGFHLPFGQEGTEAQLNTFASSHRQIIQLPYRYQFPYFTDRAVSAFDGRHSAYAFQYSTDMLINWNDAFFDTLRGNPKGYPEVDHIKNMNVKGARDYLGIFASEFYIASTKGSSGLIEIFKEGVNDLNTNAAKLNGKDISSFKIKMDSFPFMVEYLQEYPSNTAIPLFQGGSLTDNVVEILTTRAFMDANDPSIEGFNIVRVPLPSFFTPNGAKRSLDTSKDYYSKDIGDQTDDPDEYKDRVNDLNTFESNSLYAGGDIYSTVWSDSPKDSSNPFQKEYSLMSTSSISDLRKIYSEWGMPKTAEDEQWYIAMQWPYKPNEDIDPLMASKINELYPKHTDSRYGSAQDYKNRKVLVYSPATNSAVCLRPAYYLWGKDLKDLSLGKRRFLQFF